MAVAVGAEKAHEKDYSYAEAGDPTAIASIVDSVLADLRPKIVAEISKKNGQEVAKPPATVIRSRQCRCRFFLLIQFGLTSVPSRYYSALGLE